MVPLSRSRKSAEKSSISSKGTQVAFIYAKGPHEMKEAVPASAFSRGDVLVFNSNSSLSRIDDLFAGKIAGIAAADSTQSVRNKVPYVVPHADTEYMVHCASGSQFTAGQTKDILYSAGTGHYVGTSANTARAIVVTGSADFVDSARSRVVVKLLHVAGNVATR